MLRSFGVSKRSKKRQRRRGKEAKTKRNWSYCQGIFLSKRFLFNAFEHLSITATRSTFFSMALRGKADSRTSRKEPSKVWRKEWNIIAAIVAVFLWLSSLFAHQRFSKKARSVIKDSTLIRLDGDDSRMALFKNMQVGVCKRRKKLISARDLISAWAAIKILHFFCHLCVERRESAALPSQKRQPIINFRIQAAPSSSIIHRHVGASSRPNYHNAYSFSFQYLASTTSWHEAWPRAGSSLPKKKKPSRPHGAKETSTNSISGAIKVSIFIFISCYGDLPFHPPSSFGFIVLKPHTHAQVSGRVE